MDRFLSVTWERTLRQKGQHGSGLASWDQAMTTQELWGLRGTWGGFLARDTLRTRHAYFDLGACACAMG